MTRGIVLGSLIGAGLLSMALSGSQQPASPSAAALAATKIEKVRDNLYMITGSDPADRSIFSGGNTGVFVTSTGVILVDTKLAGWGQAILDRVKTVTDKPVTTIINTHTHGDHTGSNTMFPATVEIIAHENTKANMEKMDAFKGDGAKGLPKRTYKDAMTLGSGNERIELRYFGRGHTNGDTWVIYPALRVMQTGDIFAWKDAPLLDKANGGSGVEYSATVAKAVAAATNIDALIVGHSPLRTVAELKEYGQFMTDLVEAVRQAKAAGKNAADAAASIDLTAKYKDYKKERQAAAVQVIYDELPARATVRPGVEMFLADVPAALRGKRVGLITNQSAIDNAGVPDIDVIAAHKDLKLVALFAPEHGIRGTEAAGARITDTVDAKTGVPVYSLYGADRAPTPAMLANVDGLVYDLREVGGRTWTYVSTMALSMQAAANKGIPFVVLDRPNPIGGEIVEGALLDPTFASFVGMYPIPARHGMTVGELATLFNRREGINANLIVVRASGWRRAQWFDETGQPWANPSPNLRSLNALASYPGSVYFEGTNVAEGRGTDRPFEQIGAPWLKAADVAKAMNDMRLPGISFDAITMKVEASAGKYPGQTIPAIHFNITDRLAYRPVRTMLLLIDEIRRQHPRDFEWRASLDRLAGTDKVRLAIEAGTLRPLLDEWDRGAAAFRESRKAFLLY